jgi:type II secretory pathway component PulJ
MLSPRKPLARLASEESGYTLIELLVSIVIGMIVILGAFAFLQFTSEDVARTTDRIHVDQAGRTQLERLMLELQSSCVAPSVTPIQTKSSSTVLRFISGTGSESTVSTVYLREVVYTPESKGVQGTLVETAYPNTTTVNSNGEYKFSSTGTTTTLLKGIRQTKEVGKTEAERPIFQYFRYYQKSDSEPKYGTLNETPVSTKEAFKTEAEVENLTKVTVSFTLAPEGKEATTFGKDRPVAFEDSAVFRLASPSEAPNNPNQPCANQT